MITLSYTNLLALFRYQSTKLHPLEILGYAYSTRGAREFRRERPDFLPQIDARIEACLEETGSFPRPQDLEGRKVAEYLERRPDGEVRLYFTAEISMFETILTHVEFASEREAILDLLRRVADRLYLTIPSPSEETLARRAAPPSDVKPPWDGSPP